MVLDVVKGEDPKDMKMGVSKTDKQTAKKARTWACIGKGVTSLFYLELRQKDNKNGEIT